MRKLHMALAMAILTVGFSSIAVSEEAVLPKKIAMLRSNGVCQT